MQNGKKTFDTLRTDNATCMRCYQEFFFHIFFKLHEKNCNFMQFVEWLFSFLNWSFAVIEIMSVSQGDSREAIEAIYAELERWLNQQKDWKTIITPNFP
jgi:hypothetical protein